VSRENELFAFKSGATGYENVSRTGYENVGNFRSAANHCKGFGASAPRLPTKQLGLTEMHHSWPLTAAKLREARAALKWTQRALAERAGVHCQTVKYWERQTGAISGHAVDRFKTALLIAGYVPALPAPHIHLPHIPARKIMARHSKCGAKTRKGTVCIARPLPGKRRCKFHGGLSTGPKTQEGRERIAMAQRRRWQQLTLGAPV
jgi:DNA-binding XRE family transcriptional regulator